jgi:hypothetical protein
MEFPLSTSTLIERELESAPDHPVLPDARKYDLRQLRFVWGYEEGPEGLLLLEMSTYDDYACLQFSGVDGLVVPSNLLLSEVAIRILDCSGMSSVMPAAIRVRPPKGSSGLEFWAETVERIEPGSSRGEGKL